MKTLYLPTQGIETAYTVHGDSGPWVTLAHSLGCSRSMWQQQAAALSRDFRVLSYDLRGHGGSTADEAAGSMDLLVGDLVALLDGLEIDFTHFVGVSVGGMIGQALAIGHPGRVLSLTVSNSTCAMPPAAREAWNGRIAQANSQGVASLARASLERWLSPAFLEANPHLSAQLEQEFGGTSRAGYVACCEAIRDLDLCGRLATIGCPALVIAGENDAALSPAMVRSVQERIPHARFILLEGSSHLSCLDAPEAFTAALQDFLLQQECGAHREVA